MYSVLDGHPSPEEMIAKAHSLGRRAHALTDHGSISGHVLLEKAVQGKRYQYLGHNTRAIQGEELDLKPIYGMEAYTTPDVSARGQAFQRKYHLTLLAKNLTGYRNLLQLVTRSWEEGYYYRQSIDGPMLVEQGQGLIILSGCEKGGFMEKIANRDWQAARDWARAYRDIFGDDFYVEIQHFPHVSEKSAAAWAIAGELGIKTVLTCDAHYLDPDGWRYQQFLWSIRDGKPVDDFRIEHAYLWEPDRLFAFCQANAPSIDWTRVFEHTAEVGEKVERFLLPRAPHVHYPLEGDKRAYIYQEVRAFLEARGLWDAAYAGRLEHELNVIEEKGYFDYFLVVADMVRWAKSRGIFVGPARGSAAGSVVCWGLRITEIDPVHFGLLFERFVDPTRTDLPDIDVDFEDERRGEVFQYMAERWGRDCVAHISTFSRFGDKQTLEDARKSYRIPRHEVETIKRHLVERSSGDQRAELTIQDTIEEFPEAREVYERYPALQIAAGVQGKIRHTGKHAAGLVVTSEPVSNYCAIVKAGDQRLVAYDWRDSAHLNLMKIDCLGLKELSLLRMISQSVGLTLADVYALPLDDPETYEGFNQHDFLGVFQYTGLATKGVASRIKFENIRQVADVNALSRPGPLHAGATERYIRGREKGTFAPILPQPQVQPMIRDTYGQIIYQEQVMRILRDVGNMSWTDVCDIRTIMGKSKGSEAFDEYWPRWEQGTAENGVTPADARQIWEAIRLFGKHGFNLAHATAYGIVAYWSMYMKQHYPLQFYWANLVRAADDDEVTRFLHEARRKGIAFIPFDLETAQPTWHIRDGRIAMGWQQIPGVGPVAAQALSEAAPFASVADISARVPGRKANSRVKAAIAEHIGATVESLYRLDDWGRIQELVPERVQIAAVNGGFIYSPLVLVVGRLIRINKKNRWEEWKTKGKDTSRLNPEDDHDYCILIIEDETDSCMVYVDPERYKGWNAQIWGTEGDYLVVKGNKTPGLQMIHAQDLITGILKQKEDVEVLKPEFANA